MKNKRRLPIKKQLLPQLSASKIFLGCTILILSILCVSAHSSISNLSCTCVVPIRQYSSEGTDNKVWIKSIWCIREKFRLQKYGVASGFLLVNFFFIFHFDHFQDFGFGTIIDGAKGGSVTAKIFIWVKLVWVNSI